MGRLLLLHLGQNVITFRTLLHLGKNVITFRTLLRLGQNVITFRTLLNLGSFITFRPSTTDAVHAGSQILFEQGKAL